MVLYCIKTMPMVPEEEEKQEEEGGFYYILLRISQNVTVSNGVEQQGICVYL
jgi:hypothetical protein